MGGSTYEIAVHVACMRNAENGLRIVPSSVSSSSSLLLEALATVWVSARDCD